VATKEHAAARSEEICHRCLQPVLAGDAQCPACGVRLQRVRYIPFLLGIGGLLALIFVVALMVKVVQDNEIESAPPQGQGQEQPAPGTPPSLDK
jgi:hypothetical protein